LIWYFALMWYFCIHLIGFACFCYTTSTNSVDALFMWSLIIYLIFIFWSVFLCIWTASTSWFIPYGEHDDETDQPLKEIERHFDIIENDLQQLYNCQNLLTKQRRHVLTDKENKENSSSAHVISHAATLPSVSLQVTHTLGLSGLPHPFNALTLLVWWQEGHLTCKKWMVGFWHRYLSGARCRFAYGPADAAATHYLLLQ